jgi:hypothetical protein
MPNFDLGAPVKAVWAGAPAGGSYTVAITRPDGSAFTPPAITTGPPPSVTFTPNMAGRWLVAWASSGAGFVSAYTDIVNVWPIDPRFIISLDDARAGLSMPADKVSQDTLDDLRLYIAAATPVIEDICGTVVTKTVVQTVDGNKWGVPLWEKPMSIISVTEGGNPGTAVPDYVVDYSAGIIYAGRVFAPRRFQPGFASVVITYTSGNNVIPDNIRLGTRELVRHWYQIGKQGMRSMNGAMPITADAWTPSGFAVPRRVIELCTPSDRVGGFA